MMSGCGVVWMWCVCEVRGVGGVMSGKCVVRAVCVRCTACSTSGVEVQAVRVICVRCVLCAGCDAL